MPRLTTQLAPWAIAIALGCTSRQRPTTDGAPAARPLLALAPCRVEGLDESVRCGTHEVYEDRARGAGRRIGLRVVVLPATGDSVAPDPLFVLQGGPGQAASDLAGFYGGPSWAAVRRRRTIVLVDQRGTGASNPLDCDLGGSDADPQGYLGDLFPPAAVRACRAALERRADLRLYTTPIAMADLDDVRAALGYDRVDLYGTSYGARAAMVYERAYPERVRAMALKGLVPPAVVIPVPFAADAQRALDLLVADCSADAECRAAYPRLGDDIAALLARLDGGPIAAPVRDSASGRTDTLRLSRGVVAALLRSVLQSTPGAAQLPLVIHRAAAGDPAPLGKMALTYRRAGAEGISAGMSLSVTCAEDVPFVDGGAATEAARGTFLGTYWVDQLIAACAEWPRGTVPGDYRTFAPSQVPALLVSGYLDSATPPRWGDEAARLLPNGRHVVVRNGSHSFAGMTGCVDRLIAEFLEAASARALDVGCAERIARPRFVTGA